MIPIELVQESEESFRAHGGPCDGARMVVRRAPAGRDPGPGDDLRPAGNARADVEDLESRTTYRVYTDREFGLSHHDANDAGLALEQYLATEAVVRVIERANRVPLVSMHDLATLRTVRPGLPDPTPAVPLWPTPEWVPPHGRWRLSASELDHRGRGPGARVRIELLRHAVEHAGPQVAAAMGLTEYLRELRGYRWYRALDVVSRIKCLPETALRRAARTPGVHRCRSLRIEVSTRDSDEKRVAPARMWVLDSDTVLLAGDYTPSVETLARITAGGQTTPSDFQDRVRCATQLLGQAGERETHAELERQFTAELRERVGSEMEVEVRVRAKSSTG